jgi:hypothetical protein
MAENGIEPMGIMQMIQANNSSSQSGVLSITMSEAVTKTHKDTDKLFLVTN